MDNELFLKRLNELAELKAIRAARTAGMREVDAASEIFRNGETFTIDKDNNSTWSYEVKRLKIEPKACEDCGKACKNRTVSRSVYAFPKRHWRTHCSGCNRVQNPDTGLFDIIPTQAQLFYTKRLRE